MARYAAIEEANRRAQASVAKSMGYELKSEQASKKPPTPIAPPKMNRTRDPVKIGVQRFDWEPISPPSCDSKGCPRPALYQHRNHGKCCASCMAEIVRASIDEDSRRRACTRQARNRAEATGTDVCVGDEHCVLCPYRIPETKNK
jgi:hypothetical protein